MIHRVPTVRISTSSLPAAAVFLLFASFSRAGEEPGILVVMNGTERGELHSVLRACEALVGSRKDGIFDAGTAYAGEFGKPLRVERYPSDETTAKARWLRDRLARRALPGETVVLVGDAETLPSWQVRLARSTFVSDALYTDLTGDGIPDTAVARIVGTPDQMVRQIEGKTAYGTRASILCSEDTRIHLETRAFALHLSRLGYDVAVCGTRNDEVLAECDVIVHFGHGSPGNLANRFGESFVTAAAMPRLPRAPIVFADGCGTLPVGSPLLRAFIDAGALAYAGSVETVQGMTPGRFTNELVEHFLAALDAQPGLTLPRALMEARAAYVRGHPGLDAGLRDLAARGGLDAAGETFGDLLAVAEWVYYGDPRAVMPRAGAPAPLARSLVALEKPFRLGGATRSWQTSVTAEQGWGRLVLSVFADIPLADRARFSLTVLQNGAELSRLDGNHDTVYQRIGEDCRGGHISGDQYRARYLVPLQPGSGVQRLEMRLAAGAEAALTRGTGVDVWPPDFEARIGLRRSGSPRKAATAAGRVTLRDTGVPGFVAVDLASVFNRPHQSLQVGGGDNASFKTWFSRELVAADGIPFLVRTSGNDVLVSADNTENIFTLEGPGASARRLHFLLWGYSNPDHSASLRIVFAGGSTQEVRLPLSEWTRGEPPSAFDFENTAAQFKHAALVRHTVTIDRPGTKIVRVLSEAGTYGLAAITAEEGRPSGR